MKLYAVMYIFIFNLSKSKEQNKTFISLDIF